MERIASFRESGRRYTALRVIGSLCTLIGAVLLLIGGLLLSYGLYALAIGGARLRRLPICLHSRAHRFGPSLRCWRAGTPCCGHSLSCSPACN